MKRIAPYVVVVASVAVGVGITAATSPVTAASKTSASKTSHGPRPALVPAGDGQPDNGARVDSRLVSDVRTLIARYHVMVVAGCGGGRPWGPHAPYGEHPICDAADLVPQQDTSPHWPTMMHLARALGWRPSCERIGCEGSSTLNGSLRAVYYNGYPGHGDPAHNRTSAHLHISWAHAPVAARTYRRSLDRHPWPAAAWVTRIYRSYPAASKRSTSHTRPQTTPPKPQTTSAKHRTTTSKPSPQHAAQPKVASGGESPTGRATPAAGGASVVGGA